MRHTHVEKTSLSGFDITMWLQHLVPIKYHRCGLSSIQARLQAMEKVKALLFHSVSKNENV